MRRRDLVKMRLAGAAALPFAGCQTASAPETPPTQMTSPLFRVSQIPDPAVTRTNHHLGVDGLFDVMGRNGLKFFRTSSSGTENGTNGPIAADDVVLVTVNARWKYRGCTNSDLVWSRYPTHPRAPRRFQR